MLTLFYFSGDDGPVDVDTRAKSRRVSVSGALDSRRPVVEARRRVRAEVVALLLMWLVFFHLDAVCVGVGILANARNCSRTVEAQRFVLTSEDGQVRAELATLDGQYPRLTLKSPDGTKSTELSPLGVSVIDGRLSGKLPLTHLGNTGLYLTDKRGKVTLELGGASVSGPQLAPAAEIKMFDEQGTLIWHAP